MDGKALKIVSDFPWNYSGVAKVENVAKLSNTTFAKFTTKSLSKTPSTSRF
jgi:hypothetical protein